MENQESTKSQEVAVQLMSDQKCIKKMQNVYLHQLKAKRTAGKYVRPNIPKYLVPFVKYGAEWLKIQLTEDEVLEVAKEVENIIWENHIQQIKA